MRDLLLVALGVAWALLATTASAAIAGSHHDFSTSSWSQGEICIACHTPHNAKNPQLVPLWNHETTVATFTLYSSPTMDQTTDQPYAPSKVCLSCHDGTVALDSYGSDSGTHFMTGAPALGTDLSNDHPVSVYWNHQTLDHATPCSNCHLGHSPTQYVGLPFYNRYLECATCHEPHNRFPAYTKMLRMPLGGSAICLSCHGK